VLAADERDLQAVGSTRSHVVPIGSNIARQPPPGYQRENFRTQHGVQPERLAVAYFGLLNASKGLDVLLDAFERIGRALPEARLMLIGGTPGASDPTNLATAARLEARLAALGTRVMRTGYLDDAAVSAYLLAADVALLPYADGASPRRGSLLACAAHGLPIVSTQPVSAAVAEAVLAVRAGDAEALAAAVLRVHGEPALGERLRRASEALAERVSWPHIAEQHLAVYRELIG
jgi:glycosyltransferase involved in cell wall biosynthesis